MKRDYVAIQNVLGIENGGDTVLTCVSENVLAGKTSSRVLDRCSDHEFVVRAMTFDDDGELGGDPPFDPRIWLT